MQALNLLGSSSTAGHNIFASISSHAVFRGSLRASKFVCVFEQVLLFKTDQIQKSIGFKYGEFGDHSMDATKPEKWFAKNFWFIPALCAGTESCWNIQEFHCKRIEAQLPCRGLRIGFRYVSAFTYTFRGMKTRGVFPWEEIPSQSIIDSGCACFGIILSLPFAVWTSGVRILSFCLSTTYSIVKRDSSLNRNVWWAFRAVRVSSLRHLSNLIAFIFSVTRLLQLIRMTSKFILNDVVDSFSANL